jgi:hypothetical protein
MRLAKSRVITFFTEEENIPRLVTTIDQEVSPVDDGPILST